MTQPTIFQSHLLHPDRLRSGKEKCPTCGRTLRAYAKTLDKRLVLLLGEIAKHLGRSHDAFNPKEVFLTDHLKFNDFQKLKYWTLIRRVPKSTGW